MSELNPRGLDGEYVAVTIVGQDQPFRGVLSWDDGCDRWCRVGRTLVQLRHVTTLRRSSPDAAVR